ncbi:ECF-type sigma factor [Tahibacter amnicola]|uniref:ECF-type sigma factor n=1 Tax=Tahibacter amnicola TaxID=2976241 RepID=A0ABY6BC17_9GAMM|nr:ECF-type sigma factor [Tahibacter amnicola]UXI65860.1 ECF-type sigma factor [Tahibacter amnicola]
MDSETFEENLGAITQMLNGDSGGKGAIDQVFPLVYQELKAIAHRLLARGGSSTVTPTVLVHELYSKLNASEQLSVEGKRHFFSLCARVMKQIIVDYVRQKAADKRSSPGVRVELGDVDAMELGAPENVLAIEVALKVLESRDQRLAQIIEYRVFGGLELEQIAELYGVTLRQIQREWVRARIWLTDSLV